MLGRIQLESDRMASVPPALLTTISDKPMQMIADMTKTQARSRAKDEK